MVVADRGGGGVGGGVGGGAGGAMANVGAAADGAARDEVRVATALLGALRLTADVELRESSSWRQL